tara:strand:- start:1473 stop:2366 length:894 start_codon:yes stop_codon:yes gene_type:complete
MLSNEKIIDNKKEFQQEKMSNDLDHFIKYKNTLIAKIKNIDQDKSLLNNKIFSMSKNIDTKIKLLSEYKLNIKSTYTTKSKLIEKIKTRHDMLNNIKKILKVKEQNIDIQKKVRIKKELDSLERQLITERLDNNKEKILTSKIKILHKEYSKFRQVLVLQKRFKEVIKEIKQIQENINNLIDNKKSLAKKIHVLLQDIESELSSLSDFLLKKNSNKDQMNNIKEEIQQQNTKITALTNQKRDLYHEIKRVKDEDKLKKEAEIIKINKKIAKEKINKGKKVSFDELKLLLNDNSVKFK